MKSSWPCDRGQAQCKQYVLEAEACTVEVVEYHKGPW